MRKMFGLFVVLACLVPSLAFGYGNQATIVDADTVKNALTVKTNGNFNELYNALGGLATGVALSSPTVANFTNATHNHSNAAGGGSTLTSPTIVTPTITSPTITGPTITGTTSIAQEAWRSFTTGGTGGASMYGTGWGAGVTPGFMLRSDGFVCYKGIITANSGGSTTAITNIPVGLRPGHNAQYPQREKLNSGTWYSITFSTSGTATVSSPDTTTSVYLDGICYRAEN